MKTSVNTFTTDKDTIAAEMRRVLDKEFSMWYPLAIDTVDGGFFSDIDYKWEVNGEQNKFIVTQARHIWSAANAMLLHRDNALKNVAIHGIDFLRRKMWDHDFGGFYDMVDRHGDPIRENGQIVKRAYGNAFAIYGLAAYYTASGDESALRFAKESFLWLDKHAYDAKHCGYYQFMSREGAPFTEGYGGMPPKDQNSTIHLLEAFTKLYRVWPDPTVRERLESLLRIVRDTITTDRGYMMLFFRKDWTPVSYRQADQQERERNYELDHVSFGHDVETGYLMLEASEALGKKDDPMTLRVAKKMIDHTLEYGWDKQRGGVFDGGYYFPGESTPRIVRNTKEWWSQVEAFNSFLLMSEYYPNDEHHYYEMFCRQWDYCKKYVIDDEHGGWYWGGADIVPENRRSAKSSIWKCNYHTSRGLINCIVRLAHDHGDRNWPR